jgi:hypothetical protein
MQKTRAKPFLKFQRLSRDHQRLCVHAATILTLASAAVALLPFRRAIGFGGVPLGDRPKSLGAEDCVWAVEAAARRLPWRTMCIEKGLAVQRLLRRSGVDASLHYGVRHRPNGGALEAHVWVTVDDRIVIGGEEAANFAEVASYP